MNNTIKGNLNSFRKDTTNNIELGIELGVDTMAKKIKEILEPIAINTHDLIGGHTNENNNIRCKNFFRQR